MKIILVGSPQVVIPTFEVILKKHNVVAVITQPDRKSGRGLKLNPTPVAKWANLNKIKVFKPIKIIEIYEQLKVIDFDLLLTFSYGQILPQKILSLGKLSPLNIHGSLLPSYRGAAPIHHALLNNEQEIGISLIKMIKKMDAGDIYFMKSQKIDDSTNYDQAALIISNLAKNNINDWLSLIEKKQITPQPQPENYTLAPKIEKDYGFINEKLTIVEAKKRIRALTSIPGAFTFINNIRYKLFDFCDDHRKGCLTLNLQDGELFISKFQQAGKNKKSIY